MAMMAINVTECASSTKNSETGAQTALNYPPAKRGVQNAIMHLLP